nr:hypothetical protein [Tanacetum cinerariifolium]
WGGGAWQQGVADKEAAVRVAAVVVVARDRDGERRWGGGAWQQGVADKEAAVRVAAVVVVARDRDGERRVRENDMMGRIDRVIRSIFGFAGKIPPEKFSGGGWWPAGGRLKKAQEKDKIESKPDKNGKRGEVKKSLKQLQ